MPEDKQNQIYTILKYFKDYSETLQHFENETQFKRNLVLYDEIFRIGHLEFKGKQDYTPIEDNKISNAVFGENVANLGNPKIFVDSSVFITSLGIQFLMNYEQSLLNKEMKAIAEKTQEGNKINTIINQNMLFFTIFVALITFIVAMKEVAPETFKPVGFVFLIILFPLMLYHKQNIIAKFSKSDDKSDFWWYIKIVIIIFLAFVLLFSIIEFFIVLYSVWKILMSFLVSYLWNLLFIF